jgi:hypothetical protein
MMPGRRMRESPGLPPRIAQSATGRLELDPARTLGAESRYLIDVAYADIRTRLRK